MAAHTFALAAGDGGRGGVGDKVGRVAHAHKLPGHAVGVDPARALLAPAHLAPVQEGDRILHAQHQRAQRAVRALRPAINPLCLRTNQAY